MSFSAEDKTRVLTACGRHCAICHKFCGLKIELHHIIHRSEGGEDTFENCIPLCFDCHGDMRSYDHQHPKGTKYSHAELRGHRDRWYEKVRGTNAVASSGRDEELDRHTLSRLVEVLPWDGSIQFVRHNNFGYGFRLRSLDDFSRFRQECHDPNFEFIDADLEGLRAALSAAIRSFEVLIGQNTFPTGNSDVNVVPPEWEDDKPERFRTIVEKIHDATTEVCGSYDQLVKLARRKLGLPEKSAG